MFCVHNHGGRKSKAQGSQVTKAVKSFINKAYIIVELSQTEILWFFFNKLKLKYFLMTQNYENQNIFIFILRKKYA